MIHTGMILFSDPADVAVEGTEDENVYPNTIFLPGTGVQRGSTYIGDGDPLSPHWPSIPNAYRSLEWIQQDCKKLIIYATKNRMYFKHFLNMHILINRMEPEEIDGLPKIPAQPIGHDDARELLEKMGGLDSPNSWKGKIKGIDYKVIYSNWISCHNLKTKNSSTLLISKIYFISDIDRWRDAGSLQRLDSKVGSK